MFSTTLTTRDDLYRADRKAVAVSGVLSLETVRLPSAWLLVRHADQPGTGWASLTTTERTVADLVARGLTNRQVAGCVWLSTHTVSFHLRKVFRKLGVASRVELARLVAERTQSAASARGRHFASSRSVRGRTAKRPHFGWESLTDAELGVVRLAASGMTNRRIAHELGLSSHTVGSHLRHSFDKLDITSRVQLPRIVLTCDPMTSA